MNSIRRRFVLSLSGMALAATLSGMTLSRSEGEVMTVAAHNGDNLSAAARDTLHDRKGFNPGSNSSARQDSATAFQFFSREMSADNKLVKGSPFSADIVSDITQTLPDGSSFAQRAEGRVYRDSQGRTRSERTLPGDGASKQKRSIEIRDPMDGVSYLLDPETRTARQTTSYNKAVHRSPSRPQAPALPSAASVKTEQLGNKMIEGVECQGTRAVATVPAGAIGNEHPVEIVNETWYSPELGIVILARRSDPRFGDSTYRVTNITRSEPGAELFKLPSDYTVTSRKEELVDEGYDAAKKRLDETRRSIEERRKNMRGTEKPNRL